MMMTELGLVVDHV